MTLLYVNDDDESRAGSDTTLRDAPSAETRDNSLREQRPKIRDPILKAMDPKRRYGVWILAVDEPPSDGVIDLEVFRRPHLRVVRHLHYVFAVTSLKLVKVTMFGDLRYAPAFDWNGASLLESFG